MATRNSLLVNLGNAENQQDVAIKLIEYDLRVNESAILPIKILAHDTKHLSFQLGKNDNPVKKIVPLSDVISYAQQNDSTITFIISQLLNEDEIYNYYIPIEWECIHSNVIDICEGSVSTSIIEKTCERIHNKTSIRLIGESASGKTITAAHAANYFFQLGWTYSWIDLSDLMQGAHSLLLNLIFTVKKKPDPHIIFIDDSQSNPSSLKKIALILDDLTNHINCEIILVVIGWESALSNIKYYFPYTSQINCHGDVAVPNLVKNICSKYSENDLTYIRESCGGDLFIAKLLAEYKNKYNKFPNQSELAELAYSQSTLEENLSDEEIRLLYILASLSQYEIDTYIAFAERHDSEALKKMLDIKTLKMNNNYISIGHRTLATLLLLHIKNSYKNIVNNIQEPTQIAEDYLKKARPEQIVATLERLDVASLAYGKKDQHGANFLAKAWESLTILVNYISRETAQDPTWRNNTGSAVFASIALVSVGDEKHKDILNYINNKWRLIDSNKTPIPNKSIPTENLDFGEIKKTMEVEEENIKHQYTEDELAKNIDFSRMHYTWVLGLLLGLAGHTNDSVSAKKMLDIAKNSQNPDGSFYPSRVPWITARVLIGLASVGESIRTSPVVRRACDWLCRPYPEGPYKFGTWEPGTGSWNTTLGTTAMCLNALIRCGVPSTDHHVKMGISYLKGKKSIWSSSGMEIDGAFAIETILSFDGNWRNVDIELNKLLSWVRKKGTWDGDVVELSDQSHDESCKLSQISSSLIRIVWETVRSELPLLLEGLSISKYSVYTENIPEPVLHIYEKCLESINEIKIKVGEEVRSRVEIREQSDDAMPQVEAEQTKWEQRKTDLQYIESYARGFSSQSPNEKQNQISELVEKINSLGNQCFKNNMWQKIEVPN